MSDAPAISVLLVEDNEADARLVDLYLQSAEHTQFELTHVTSLAEAINEINRNEFNLILLDLSLPDASGIDTVTGVTSTVPYTAVVVMTGIYDGLLAANAIAAGAQDFLVKGDADSIVLERTIINAMQRTEIHKQLQKTQKSYDAILESTNNAVITTDAQGIIKSWNRAASELFECHRTDIIGKNSAIIFSDKSKNEFSSHLKDCLSNKDKLRHADAIELEGMRSNGQTFPVEISLSSWHIEEGQFSSIVLRDITERQRMERLKSEFVSTVSHELRTPLTAIMGSLQLVISDVIGDISEEPKKMLAVAYSNSERLLLIINDILDIDKIESNKMDFTIEPVEVMSIINQAISENKSYAKRNNASIELAQSVSDKYINIDRARMLQVMSNLISNSAKFSSDNGVIKIIVTDKANSIRIAVEDTGLGISDEFKGRIFQKFAQADSTDTRAPGGTGLGLNITKSLVEYMGGKISFESEPNVKTTFFVDIPLSDKKD